jgi:hypothetical protein
VSLLKKIKKRLAHYKSDKGISHYTELKQQLQQVWKAHEQTFHTGINTQHKNLGVNGVLKVYDCLVKTDSTKQL